MIGARWARCALWAFLLGLSASAIQRVPAPRGPGAVCLQALVLTAWSPQSPEFLGACPSTQPNPIPRSLQRAFSHRSSPDSLLFALLGPPMTPMTENRTRTRTQLRPSESPGGVPTAPAFALAGLRPAHRLHAVRGPSPLIVPPRPQPATAASWSQGVPSVLHHLTLLRRMRPAQGLSLGLEKATQSPRTNAWP